MINKYTRRMLEAFPNNFGFTSNKTDVLNNVIDYGGVLLSELEREQDRKIKNLSITTCDPVIPSTVYFVDISTFSNVNSANVIPTASGLAEVVDNEEDFLDMDITGFDYVERLEPSGIFSSGLLGLSYGFDWDDPTTYITASGSQYVMKYSDLGDTPEYLNYTYGYQSYGTTGGDEWVNFTTEVAGSGLLPSGVLPDDEVKVAYLRYDVEDSLVIIDAGNLQNPENPDSDGITVSSDDYVVENNRIVFSNERSNYNPAIVTVIGDATLYTYPSDYQPDIAFDSTFIAEYRYVKDENPRYLTGAEKLHNLNLAEDPEASY